MASKRSKASVVPHPFLSLMRPEVEGFVPYLPGRSMDSVRRELGLSRLYKLASNENALGPSPRALAAVQKAGPDFFRYPDGASVALREALAKQAGVLRTEVVVGAGSDELIELLGKTFLNPKDSIVVSAHAFIRYQMAAEMMGAKVITTPMKDFTHDLSAMAAAVRDDTKLLFIANPNNPTGTYNTHTELATLLSRVGRMNRKRRKPLLVVVDEAYFEYASALEKNYPDTRALRRRHAHLIVLRTFSKIHALAGLRIGYGYGDPAVISAIDRVRPPFNVSTAGQAAALASLLDTAHIRRGVQLVVDERVKILPALARMDLPFLPSAGNFVLIDVSPMRGQVVFESMLRRGIIVRSMDEYGFLHHIRVTYGRPKENIAFLKALKEVVSQ